MVATIVGVVGWTKKQQQDAVFNAVESGRAGKAQFTPGENTIAPLLDAPFGNSIRVELSVASDADAIWLQLKNYLAANSPTAYSRIRRLDCDWDGNNMGCTVVQQQTWMPDGSVVTRP